MFVKKPFEGMDAGMKTEILREANERLESVLYAQAQVWKSAADAAPGPRGEQEGKPPPTRSDGKWIIDYVRIRIRARKVSVCPKR